MNRELIANVTLFIGGCTYIGVLIVVMKVRTLNKKK